MDKEVNCYSNSDTNLICYYQAIQILYQEQSKKKIMWSTGLGVYEKHFEFVDKPEMNSRNKLIVYYIIETRNALVKTEEEKQVCNYYLN